MEEDLPFGNDLDIEDTDHHLFAQMIDGDYDLLAVDLMLRKAFENEPAF